MPSRRFDSGSRKRKRRRTLVKPSVQYPAPVRYRSQRDTGGYGRRRQPTPLSYTTEEGPVLEVLQVNSHLSIGGGPQSYMQQVTAMLCARGHMVHKFGMLDELSQNDPEAPFFVAPIELLRVSASSSLAERLGGALRALWYVEASRKLEALLDTYPVDVAHVHNIRYELSPSILATLKERGIPIVQTVHDYGLICHGAASTPKRTESARGAESTSTMKRL